MVKVGHSWLLDGRCVLGDLHLTIHGPLSFDQGTIVQQLLLLPYHPSHPTPLPFQVTHVILAGTMAAPLTEFRYRLQFAAPKSGLSLEEKKEVIRDNVEHFFTPAWVQDVRNAERLQWWLNRMVVGR